MSLPYRYILRQASRSINAVTGTNKTDLEAAYTTSPLTATQIGNTNFTISMIIDKMLGVVGEIVHAYTSVPGHPFRAFNLSQTSNLANGAARPSVNSAALPIVGAFGTVRDATDQTVCKKQPGQIIEAIRAGMTDQSLTGSYYYYDWFEDRIIHTRTNVVIDVCTWDLATQLALVAAGNAPIPDVCMPLAVAGLVSELIVDDEFVQQAGIFRSYFGEGVADIRAGKSEFRPAPPLTMGENK